MRSLRHFVKRLLLMSWLAHHLGQTSRYLRCRSAATAQPVRRHSKGRRARSPSPKITQQLPINSSDSDYTDSDSPSEEIEKHICTKAKRHRPSSSGSTAFDMGWAKLGDEVSDRLRTRIHTNEYFSLRILRTSYDLDPRKIVPLPH